MIFINFRSFLSKDNHSRTPVYPPKENKFPLYESVLKLSNLYLSIIDYQRIRVQLYRLMDRDTPSGSNTGEQISIEFKGRMLLLAEPAPGKVFCKG